MRTLRSTTKPKKLTFTEFHRRHVEPTFKRLRKKGVHCISQTGKCCIACCRNDIFALNTNHRFLRLWRFWECAQRMCCVLGEVSQTFVVVQREFAKSGVVFERHGGSNTNYACIIRPRKSPHSLWNAVRTHVQALAFTSWIKGLVAARRFHPSRINFDALAEDLRVDIAELRR